MDGFAVGFIALMVVVVIGVIVLATVMDRRRTQAAEEYAQREGYAFDLNAEGIREAMSGFRLFQRGHGRRTRRLLSKGSRDEEVWVFDYSYRTGGGKNQRTHRQTVVAFPTMPDWLPAFQLRPERFLHKIGAALGFGDINFEEHQEFSKRFLLKGADEMAVRELFDQRTMDALLEFHGVCVEGEGRMLVAYRPGRFAKIEDIGELVREGKRVRAVFANRKGQGVRYRMTTN